jgi:hypothetical protein
MRLRFGLIGIGAVLLAGGVTFAQTGSTDVASLERKLQDAQLALARVEPTSLERELRDLQDEVAYLRVKVRRGESVSTRETRDLNDKLDRYTARLTSSRGRETDDRGFSGPDTAPRGAGNAAPRGANDTVRNRPSNQGPAREIPASTEVDVRLQTRLSSKDAVVEDRVEATTLVDLYLGNDLLVPAGSLMVGYVAAVDKATRTDRKGSLAVTFTRLTSKGRTRDIRASVTQAIESDGMKGEVGKVGAGAGVGAIIGGIIGGVKGALAGILIGGGGVLVATEGKDVEVPDGTILRVRFDSSVPLTE